MTHLDQKRWMLVPLQRERARCQGNKRRVHVGHICNGDRVLTPIEKLCEELCVHGAFSFDWNRRCINYRDYSATLNWKTSDLFLSCLCLTLFLVFSCFLHFDSSLSFCLFSSSAVAPLSQPARCLSAVALGYIIQLNICSANCNFWYKKRILNLGSWCALRIILVSCTGLWDLFPHTLVILWCLLNCVGFLCRISG